MNYTKQIQTLCLILLSGLTLNTAVSAESHVEAAKNGLKLPDNYKNWKVISQSHRIDNHTVRIILGNDIAVKAARTGDTHPWPNGSILGKMVWKQKTEEHWPTAIAPGKFVHAEFMFKNNKKYKDTGGWGYARWVGMKQKPYGKDRNFFQECVNCHTAVKDNDWVFTTPAIFP